MAKLSVNLTESVTNLHTQQDVMTIECNNVSFVMDNKAILCDVDDGDCVRVYAEVPISIINEIVAI